jgi:hypothetical protein
MKDSVLYGSGGSGAAGPRAKGGDRDAIVWRECTASARYRDLGSAAAPAYSDPVAEMTAKVLRCLEEPADDKVIAECQVVSLPTGLLFEAGQKLSATGKQVLRFMARNLRRQPYDVHIRVDAPAALPQALAACKYLIDAEGLLPGRLAVGVLPEPAGAGLVYFTLVKRG